MGFKLFLLFEKFLMILPKSVRKRFFCLLASVAYYVSSRYKKVAKQNLNFAFDGQMSSEEIDKITRYSFKNLLFNFLHLIEIRYMNKKELEKKVKIENIEAVDKVHSENRAVIYVLSHYCSWELGAAATGAFIEPVTAVYKKMKNPTFQEWLLGTRAVFNIASLEKTKVIKPLIKLIKEGKATAILIDTNINKREGVMVDFMGKKIRQTTSPAYLARKFDAAIIPITIKTEDEDYYTMTIYDEIPVEKTDNMEEDIQKATQLQADWLTNLVTNEPKFWFWLHRRWKNDYPEIYEK